MSEPSKPAPKKFTTSDILASFLIVLTIWVTADYVYRTYYARRPEYFLPTPESVHNHQAVFAHSLDMRAYPSYYATPIMRLRRGDEVKILHRSCYDESGNIWYKVLYGEGARVHTGWVHALYLRPFSAFPP